jgi:hypothetical protein
MQEVCAIARERWAEQNDDGTGRKQGVSNTNMAMKKTCNSTNTCYELGSLP